MTFRREKFDKQSFCAHQKRDVNFTKISVYIQPRPDSDVPRFFSYEGARNDEGDVGGGSEGAYGSDSRNKSSPGY